MAGVITCPTMRADGSVLSTPGYDPETRLVLLDPPRIPPPGASRKYALIALEMLEDLLTEFCFVDEGSRSVALSALITPICRGSMPVAPLHAMRGPVAGSGKSYLVDIASGIATGELLAEPGNRLALGDLKEPVFV